MATQIAAVYPATPSQQGFMLGALSRPDASVFIEQTTLGLAGELDVARLRAAWARAVQHHAILRTGFALNVSDAPRQVVLREVDATIDHVDAAHLSREAQDAQLADLLATHRAAGFDLRRPPLVRVAVQRRTAASHMLVWTHHHAILDGLSQAQLLAELLADYNGCDPVAADKGFGDYATWLSDRDRDEDIAFWRAQLHGYAPAPAILARPLESPDEPFGVLDIELPIDLDDAVRQLGLGHGLSTGAAIIGAWALVAAAFRRTTDTAIGVTVSGRSAEEGGYDHVVGPFVNTLPYRVHVDATRNLPGWLFETQSALATLSRYAHCSTGEIRRWLETPGDRPLFDSVVALAIFDEYDANPPSARALHIVPATARGHGGRTLHAVSLTVERRSTLTIRLVHDRARVDDETAVSLVDALALVLRTASLAPATSVAAMMTTLAGQLPACETVTEVEEPPQGADAVSLEATVGAVFAEVLGRRSVPMDVDFVSLGGHSLLAIELLATLRQRLRVDLTLQDLFTASTPAGVARVIRRLMGSPLPEPVAPSLLVVRQPEDEQPFELSDIQAAYWAGRQQTFDLSGVDSHVYVELDVPDLDRDRLEIAVQQLIARHGMLRATVGDDGRQRVRTQAPFYEIAVTELSAASPEAIDRQLEAMRARLSCARRHPGVWPLFSIEAAGLPGGVTRLFFSVDLLIGDARSWDILTEDLLAYYRDPGTELPPLSISYRDYVSVLETLKTTPGYQRARDYWQGRLASLPAPPALPRVERVQPGEAHFTRRPMRLERDQVGVLYERAAALGVTPSVLLLQLFAEVLCGFAPADACLINLTISNRQSLLPGIDRLVGNCTTLSLTAVSCLGSTFAERARQTQQRLWTDLDHRLYSGLDVLRDLRDRDRNPLHAQAPVVFTSTLGPRRVAGHGATPVPGTVPFAIGQTPQVILDFQTYPVGDAIAIVWDSVDAVFPPGLIDAMFATHQRALDTLLATGALPPVLVATDGPAFEAPPYLGGRERLFDPILRRVAESPEAIAVAAADRRLTYGELRHSAIALAAAIGPLPRGAIVAIIMDKGWEPVVGVLGTFLAGAAFVPMDPSWPAARLESLLDTVGATVALTCRRVRERLRLPAAVRTIVIDADDPIAPPIAAVPFDAAAVPTQPDDIAYVIFTSGSTGVPKGVVMQHDAVLNTILDMNARFAVGRDDRVLAISPLVFDLSIYDLFGLLAAGGTIVMPRTEDVQNPSQLARLIEAEQVTIWNSVPVLMDLQVGAPDAAQRLRSLRLCLLSGDWIPVTLPDAVRRSAPAARVVSLGGATEAAIWSILYEIGDVPASWTSIPYGHAMIGQEVRVLDAHFRPCPIWVAGELYIGGNGLALGYWNDRLRTDAQFVADPHTGRRLFKTGDWGRLRSDGEIEFLGRRDAQVKVNGHRVELQEIEAAMRTCPGVEAAAVVAVGDGAERRLAGFACGTAESHTIRATLQTRLPSYMVPPAIRLLTTLPLSATGKVDRSALARLAASSPGEAAAPAGPAALDDDLRAIVTTAVGMAVEAETDLLAGGLTSVGVIRMMNAIERRFGRRPDVRAFFRTPTLHELTRLLLAPVDALAPAVPVPPPAIVEEAETPVWRGWQTLTDTEQRQAFRRARPQFPAAPPSRRLPAIEPLEASTYEARRSARQFSQTPVQLDVVSRFLRCFQATGTGPGPRFLYPSAGGLYGVDVFFLAAPRRVDGLAGGLYYYHPAAHDLVEVVSDIALDFTVWHGTANKTVTDTASFILLFVTDPANSAPLYGQDAQWLNSVNSGYMGQLAADHARLQGLGSCPLHGLYFDRIRWLFPYSERAALLHAVAVGYV